MKLLILMSLTMALLPGTGKAAPSSKYVAYDENATATTQLKVIGSITAEPQFTSNHEDVQRARVVAVINKSPIGSTSQIMRVYVDGNLAYEWKTSTGREQVEKSTSGRTYLTTTPVGYFRPTKAAENHFSLTWKANMPHAVFFVGGVAIHASTHINQLGKRASGGCVRLAPENAKIFYDLVNSAGIASVPKIERGGKSAIDAQGNPVMIKTWNVLIIVENHA